LGEGEVIINRILYLNINLLFNLSFSMSSVDAKCHDHAKKNEDAENDHKGF